MVWVQKWPFFHFFFRQYRPGKCLLLYSRAKKPPFFYNIVEKENACLGYKRKKFKKAKNWHFLKRFNPWFWFQIAKFSNFFFLGNISQENVFYNIVERKNACLDYKIKKFKKPKNWHFPKGVNPWFWSKNGHFFNFFFLPI